MPKLHPKHKKLFKHPFGVVKTATNGSYLICADNLIEKDNEPLRVMHLEETGLSQYTIGEFIDFGRAFDLVEAVPLMEIARFAYRLTDTGQRFYEPLLEWEGRLRAGFDV